MMSTKPRLNILLVDDDYNDCVLFGITVQKTGLNIRLETVRDGEEAVDYLEGRGVYADRAMHPLPALVVLDLNMRLSGAFEFLDWRKAAASFLSLPVVIFSGFAYKGAIETALAMGPKPSSQNRLSSRTGKRSSGRCGILGWNVSQPRSPNRSVSAP